MIECTITRPLRTTSRRTPPVTSPLCVLLLTAALVAPNAHAARVLLVAGSPSHGYGAHEYAAGVDLLGDDLAQAQVGIEVERVVAAWPTPEQLGRADALVLFMDGGGSHPVLDHLDALAPHLDRGMGLMAMHYAVEVPEGPASESFLRWIGGYYEDGWSTNPHWQAEVSLAESHPITRGVTPFRILDEWYFNIRFRTDGAATPIVTAAPDAEARAGSTSWPRGPHAHITEAAGRPETLAWALERPDGGRGVGFTGGHFHWNWAHPAYRRLVLNAIAWVAGTDVPRDGIPLQPRTLDDLFDLAPASLLKRLERMVRFDPDQVRERFAGQTSPATAK